jgi:translation initiation factor IF-2
MFATAARRLAPALAAEARLLDGGCGGTSNLLAQPLLSLRAWAEARGAAAAAPGAAAARSFAAWAQPAAAEGSVRAPARRGPRPAGSAPPSVRRDSRPPGGPPRRDGERPPWRPPAGQDGPRGGGGGDRPQQRPRPIGGDVRPQQRPPGGGERPQQRPPNGERPSWRPPAGQMGDRPQQRPPGGGEQRGGGGERGPWRPREASALRAQHSQQQQQRPAFGEPRAPARGYANPQQDQRQPARRPAAGAARPAPRGYGLPQGQHQQRWAPPGAAPPRPRAPAAPKAPPPPVVIPDGVTVAHLAGLLDVPLPELERVLAELGEPPRSEEDVVAGDAAELAALELGREAVAAPPARRGARGAAAPAGAAPRPPVVAVMGHVDHGKTSLLDALRRTSVAAREAGGITQAVGAFEVAMPGSGASLTFLDTPGHAAFAAMRARGAAGADVVVLAVAADDGVMPQTLEALAHARAAGAALVVALTKSDLPGADPARARAQLEAAGLALGGAGGAQAVEVSAKTGAGLAALEEALLLEAEALELSADPAAPAAATVVEARLERGRGPVATVIVSRGTLRVGQALVAGAVWGRVRSLRAPSGALVDEVLPGRPAEVDGLRALPAAGDELAAVASEERAARVGRARSTRAERARVAALGPAAAASLAAPPPNSPAGVLRAARVAAARGEPTPAAAAAAAAAAAPRELPVVLKAESQGAVEAARDAVAALATDAVRVRVVHAGVGPVALSDVQLATPSGALVLGFGVRAAADAEAEARRHGLTLSCRRVIYELLADAGAAVAGLAPRERREVVAGAATVLQVFPLKEGGAVAGCRVGEGTLRPGLRVRVLRGGEPLHEGPCASLRRGKLDAPAVGKGAECGVVLEGFSDFRPGDVLHCLDEE